MGILPIERLRAGWAGLVTPDPRKCAWCKKTGETFKVPGSYRYCSPECAQADAEDQINSPM